MGGSAAGHSGGPLGRAIPAAAAPANAAGDQPKPLTSRRLFDQSRPGVQLVTVEFSAGLGVPEPVVTADNWRALETMAADRTHRGEIPATRAAARGAIVEEIARDPFRWFTASSKVYRAKVKLTATAVPASIVKELLRKAHVSAAEGEAGSAYREALDAIDRQWYKRSLPLLDRVQALDPGPPVCCRLAGSTGSLEAMGRSGSRTSTRKRSNVWWRPEHRVVPRGRGRTGRDGRACHVRVSEQPGVA